MPHSSGGGSHGGGSHSSSHSSGSGSRSGGYNSYSSVPFQFSSKPFSNCYTYVSYSDGKPVYKYANLNHIEESEHKTNVHLIKVFWAVFQIVLIIGSFFTVKIPVKLKPEDITLVPYIVDNLDCIDDDVLMPYLYEFQEKTGITPVIYTISNSDWQTHYTSLENYAYETYINIFSDEKCWFLVYSSETLEDGWDDWYWEGMQGDKTDTILSENKCDIFNNSFHDGLLNENISVSDAIAGAFEKLIPVIMIPEFSLMTIVLILANIWLFIMLYNALKKEKNILDVCENYTLVPYESIKQSKIVEDRCDFCGGIYVIGTAHVCPYCGGTLHPHREDGTRVT